MDEVRDTFRYGRGWHRRYTEAPNELWESNCTLTPSQIVVYLYLLSCVNVDRNGCTAWPSYETVGEKTRQGRSTVIRAVKVLDDKGYIFKKQRVVKGENISNLYEINHPTETEDWDIK